MPAVAGRGRLAAREPAAERLREELREPAAAGPPARLLRPPLPLLQRGAAAARLPPAAAARRPLRPGARLAGRPGRLCPRAAAGRGARALGGRGGAAAGAAARELALPQPALQRRLRLLLPHLLPDAHRAGLGPRPWRRLVAAGAARLLLPGGLPGLAVVVVGPARAPGGGGGEAAAGAGRRGAAGAGAAVGGQAVRPGAALRRRGLVGGVQRPRGAARRAPPAAALPGRGRRLPAGPGAGSLLPHQGSSSSSSVVQHRGRKSACDPTPEEVQLRVAGRNRSRLPWQWQNVPETFAALHFQRADDSLGLGRKAVV